MQQIFSREIYVERRAALMSRMGCGGVVLIPANELSPNSYLANAYYFRQDATFRYLFGLDQPSLWGVLDLDTGGVMLFGEEQGLQDIIWTGVLPSLSEQASRVGVEATHPTKELKSYIDRAVASGRRVHILPPYRGESKVALAELLNIKIAEISQHLSPELIFSIAALRERKGAEEIEAIERGYAIGYEMHTTAMQMVRPGVVEREIGGTLEGIARRLGSGVSFPPICTQHGETLHNVEREGVLQDGRLFLCDAGGESLDGYCSDHTRTYPVNGRFTAIQRDIYNVTLAAQRHTASIARPEMRYSDLQRECYRVLGEGLRDLGFLRGTIEEILDSGAVSLFMPHGVGHGLGLDVHDCEAFGERTFDVAQFSEFAERSTSCIIRSRWILRSGTVLSNEPGVYFIPELIKQRYDEGLYRETVNYELLSQHLDFGGIRIEDCTIITDDGAREVGESFTKKIPRTVEQIETFMRESRL